MTRILDCTMSTTASHFLSILALKHVETGSPHSDIMEGTDYRNAQISHNFNLLLKVKMIKPFRSTPKTLFNACQKRMLLYGDEIKIWTKKATYLQRIK